MQQRLLSFAQSYNARIPLIMDQLSFIFEILSYVDESLFHFINDEADLNCMLCFDL